MNSYILQNFLADELLIYLRKSRTDDPLLTVAEVLERHEHQLDEWVERNAEGGPIPEANRYREVGSGETIAARPRLQELLRRVESPKVKAIVIKDTSRLSRGDLEDIGYLVKILRHTNTLVITMDRGVYDLNNERDRDDFKRELMRGNDYLEYAKKVMQAGTLASVKEGNYLGTKAPYGYKKIAYKEGKRTVHTLEPHPEEAPVVKRIFEMYASGIGSTRIADALEAEHIPGPTGGKWATDYFGKLFDNVHYLGKIKWFHKKVVKVVQDGEVVEKRPRTKEYLITEGKHPAIIDQELWDAVQARKGSIPKHPKNTALTNPLAGLVFCKVCGKAMVARKYNDKQGNERCAPRVLCQNRKHCQQASSRLVDVIDDIAKKLSETVDEFEERIKFGANDSIEQHKQLIERLEKRLADLRETEVKQWAEKMEHGMPEHVFRQLNDKTVQEIEDVQQTLYDARENAPEPVDLGERIVTFKAALNAMRNPDVTVKEKNDLLKACIDRIEYSREKYTKIGTPKGMTETDLHLHYELRI